MTISQQCSRQKDWALLQDTAERSINITFSDGTVIVLLSDN